jgi:hypothetical protein
MRRAECKEGIYGKYRDSSGAAFKLREAIQFDPVQNPRML